MTADDLLLKAVAFDGGPPVHYLGHILDAEVRTAKNYSVVLRPHGWVVSDGAGRCIYKSTDAFADEPGEADHWKRMDSGFPSAREAFEFLSEWRKRELIRARENNFPTYTQWLRRK